MFFIFLRISKDEKHKLDYDSVTIEIRGTQKLFTGIIIKL